MGIEPTSEAWEAYDITQKHAGLAAFLQFSERLNWKIMENGNPDRESVRKSRENAKLFLCHLATVSVQNAPVR